MLKILSSVTYLAEKNIIFNVVKLCQRLYADKQIDTLQYLFKLWVPRRLGLSLIVCFCSLRKKLLSRKSFYSHERLRDTTRATHLKWAFSERVSNKLKEQKSLTLCIWFLIVLSYFFSLEGKIFIATVHYKEDQQWPSQANLNMYEKSECLNYIVDIFSKIMMYLQNLPMCKWALSCIGYANRFKKIWSTWL